MTIADVRGRGAALIVRFMKLPAGGAMEMYGVKGFPTGAEVPSVVLKVRAPDPQRALALAGAREIAAGLRLEAIHIGGALPAEGVFYEGPWPWPNRAN